MNEKKHREIGPWGADCSRCMYNMIPGHILDISASSELPPELPELWWMPWRQLEWGSPSYKHGELLGEKSTIRRIQQKLGEALMLIPDWWMPMRDSIQSMFERLPTRLCLIRERKGETEPIPESKREQRLGRTWRIDSNCNITISDHVDTPRFFYRITTVLQLF